MRIPPITGIGTAIRLYYEKIELYNSDIYELFGKRSSATVTKLKEIAKATMIEDQILPWNSRAVNTKCAYKAWGLDIDDLEKRLSKLRKLQLGEIK